VPAEIAARVPVTGTDIPTLAWIDRSSRFSSVRAVNRAQALEGQSSKHRDCPIIPMRCDIICVSRATARSSLASLATCFHHAAVISSDKGAPVTRCCRESWTHHCAPDSWRFTPSIRPDLVCGRTSQHSRIMRARAISGVVAAMPGSSQSARRPISAPQ
jgi:hypothetical protein